MARLVTYRCPDCKGEFEHLHHPSDDPPPDQCELCGSYMGDTPEKAPVIYLNIGSAKGKVGDKLYRDMERAADARIEQAAEMTGASVADLSAMKVTDLKGARHQGERAAPSAAEAEKRLSYDINGQKVAPEMQNPQAAAFIEQTTSGPDALTTRKVLTSMPHAAIAANLTRAGQMGKF